MLRMYTPGLPQSRLNRSMGSALLLHTVHSKTWGGSRSTWPPTPPQCFPPGEQLFRMHPCSFSPITLLSLYCSSCPWPLPLLVLIGIFRYSLPSPPLLVYLRGEIKKSVIVTAGYVTQTKAATPSEDAEWQGGNPLQTPELTRSLLALVPCSTSGVKAFLSLSRSRTQLFELSGSLLTSSVKAVKSTTNTVIIHWLIHPILFILLIQYSQGGSGEETKDLPIWIPWEPLQ